ncbi:MAG: hypothetical protein JWO10_608, partial [Microbacteriaceae bacterium]|nr:hypothetical protein [Microbacteriaceae bacterium]
MAHGVMAHKLHVDPSDIIVRDGMP